LHFYAGLNKSSIFFCQQNFFIQTNKSNGNFFTLVKDRKLFDSRYRNFVYFYDTLFEAMQNVSITYFNFGSSYKKLL